MSAAYRKPDPGYRTRFQIGTGLEHSATGLSSRPGFVVFAASKPGLVTGAACAAVQLGGFQAALAVRDTPGRKAGQGWRVGRAATVATGSGYGCGAASGGIRSRLGLEAR